MMISSSTIHMAKALTMDVRGLSLLTQRKHMSWMQCPAMTATATETINARIKEG